MPATKLSHQAFKAWLTCEKEKMPVHGVETNGTVSSCWIASEEGKSFEIYVETASMKQVTSCHVHVDGTRVARGMLGWKNRSRWHARGAESGPLAVRKMYFSAVALADDDQKLPLTAGNMAHLGTIRVELRRIKVLGKKNSSKPYSTEALASSVVVHEREKKLGAHHTRLGEEVQRHSSNLYSVKDLDGEPCAVFEFRYRPQAILQAQGIIGVEPSSQSIDHVQAVPKKRKADSQPLDVDASTSRALRSKKPKLEHDRAGSGKREDYVRGLEERVRALEAQLPDGAAVVKAEEDAAHVPFPFKKGEVIDLTIDDD